MRVLIVDDHEVVRRGVRSLLAQQPGCEVCGEAADGRDAVEKARELLPDVIVMDASMPRLNGLEATRLIKNILPQAEVLMLSQHESKEVMRQAFEAGARGYVVKSSIARDLLQALEAVGRHEPFCASQDKLWEFGSPPGIRQRGEDLERALRESEKRYRITFEMAAVGVAHVDPDGKWLRLNKKFCEILGYPHDEVTRLRWQDVTHPDDLAADLANAQAILDGRADQYAMEKRYIRKDGSVVWVNLTVSGVRGASGELSYFISVVEDITEHKQAEEALKRSEKQFRILANSIPQLAWMADENGWIFWYNRRWYDYTGTNLEEMEGWGWRKVHHPGHVDRVVDRIRRSWETGEAWEDTFPLRGRDGEYRWFLSRALPIRDNEGHVVRWFGTSTDISKERQAEEALRQSEERLRAVFNHTYSFLALLSMDGTVLDANHVALEGTGFCRNEVIGRKFWETWWASMPEEQQALKASIEKAARGAAVREECYYRLRDGRIRFAERTLNGIQDGNGSVAMIVVSGLDMTEQKELRTTLEEKVGERTRELEQKNLELTKQTEVVSELSGRLLQIQDNERRRIARELHDSVGQSLAALSINISRVRREAERLSPAAAEAMAENAALVEQTSNEIRTISHLLYPPLLDEVGLRSALQWYIDGFRDRSNIQVKLELPADFGRLPREFETSLFRIVQECLTNIHRHSGSPTAVIRISRSLGEVKVEVRDKGKGIPAETQIRISAGETSGVGLRGMSERVRQLGGKIEMQSDGNGTLIAATLPLSTRNELANLSAAADKAR